MANQRSNPPRESADTRSEMLSDSTDLDALLAAILSDDVASVPAAVARPEAPLVVGRPASEGRSGPTLVSARLFPAQPDLNSSLSVTTDDEADAAWVADLRDFTASVKTRNLHATEQSDAATESATFIESPIASRTWRDKVPVPTTTPLLLAAGLSAVALIILVAYILL